MKAGLGRAKLEGRHIGRPKLELDREAVLEDRAQGMSLKAIARKHQVGKGSIYKLLNKASKEAGHKAVGFRHPSANSHLTSGVTIEGRGEDFSGNTDWGFGCYAEGMTRVGGRWLLRVNGLGRLAKVIPPGWLEEYRCRQDGQSRPRWHKLTALV